MYVQGASFFYLSYSEGEGVDL